MWITANPQIGPICPRQIGLVLRDFRIDFIRPGSNTAGEVVQLREAVLRQEFRGALAATAGLALYDDFLRRVELAQALRQVSQRDKMTANLRNLVFEGLANVKDEQVVALVNALFEFLHAHLGNTVLYRRHFCLRDDAAELLIVDQLCHGGVRAADGAVGILAQLELAEAHVERIDQEQAPDERLAFAEDQLDDLCGLDDADEAGQNAKYAAFRAGGDQPRRRRFGIKA